jgi:hypothetical protein
LISSHSLYAIDVTAHEKVVEETYYKLLRDGYITEYPEPSIDTQKTASKVKHHFSFLPEYGQKRLVYVLVVWEQELTPIKRLEEEESEILATI